MMALRITATALMAIAAVLATTAGETAVAIVLITMIAIGWVLASD